MARHPNIIPLSEVPAERMKTPAGSPFGAERRRVGAAIGAKKLGYGVFSVAPGKAAFPYHLHHTNEEMIYIFEGEGLLRIGNEEERVAAGVFIALPPGASHPHQLVNTSERDLKYLCVSTMEYPDITEYPDSQKIGAMTCGPGAPGFRAFYRKGNTAEYYDGESGAEVERMKKGGKRPG